MRSASTTRAGAYQPNLGGTAVQPRTVIDISLMDRRRERPRCPVSRLGRSHPQAGPACQAYGDPAYLIAAEKKAFPPQRSNYAETASIRPLSALAGLRYPPSLN